jgi:hypothetical protein
MNIKHIKTLHQADLLRYPNVCGVGVGPRIKAGKPTGEMAIKVYVTQKVENLPEKDRIPQFLESYPTDIEVMKPLRANKVEKGITSLFGGREQ